LLNARSIRFVMRCDNDSGWRAARTFLRSGAAEARVVLSAPNASDVRDWGCPAEAPQARLIRQIAPNGQVRALVTNLDATQFPAEQFADLYHRR
jgi:hemolysin-activating ACP:hemolysin acyltransferase